MDLGLQDKVIVVSGGAAGIGEAISRACLDEGARVVAITRMSPKIEPLLTEMKTKGVSFRLMEAELADWKQCKAAIDDVLSVEGRIDGLVNNAGANDGVGLANGDPERFMESLRQNLLHCYALAHDALPALKESQGSIVNISSKVAITGQGGTSAYAAAKGAQLALTREWAAELLPFNIRVNCILPAEVMTPLYRRWLDTVEDPEAKLKEIVRHIPFGHRMTTAAEIASMAVFLLSNKQSGHTTGQNLVVDGGYVHLDRSLT
jgi:L-fucose dehydrogenase